MVLSTDKGTAALIRFANSDDDGVTRFAIVADSTSADYVWADDETAAFGDDRLEMLLEDQEVPATPQDWLDLASTGLRHYAFEADVPATNLNEGIKLATRRLVQAVGEGSHDADGYSSVAAQAALAFDEVSQDYPGLGEDDEDIEAMNHFVLHALGPIDPEGPNGWIIREMDGEARPEDANAFVNFAPGVTAIGSVEEESEPT